MLGRRITAVLVSVSVAVAVVVLAPPASAMIKETRSTSTDALPVGVDPRPCQTNWSTGSNEPPSPLEVGDTLNCLTGHVIASTGEGVSGPVTIALSGKGVQVSERGISDEYGIWGFPTAVEAKAGIYNVLVRFGGAIKYEYRDLGGGNTVLVQIHYLPSVSVSQVVVTGELEVSATTTPAPVTTGVSLVRGELAFENAAGKCLTGCVDVTATVRNRKGKPVRNARVVVSVAGVLPATAVASPVRNYVANEVSPSGALCYYAGAGIEGETQCAIDRVTMKTNAQGRIELRYWLPSVSEDAQARLTFRADDGEGSTGFGGAEVFLKPNVVLPAMQVSLSPAGKRLLGNTMADRGRAGSPVSQTAAMLNNWCEGLDIATQLLGLSPGRVVEAVCLVANWNTNVYQGGLSLAETAFVTGAYCVPQSAVLPGFNLRNLIAWLPLGSTLTKSDFLETVHSAFTEWSAAMGYIWPTSDPSGLPFFRHDWQWLPDLLEGQMELRLVEATAPRLQLRPGYVGYEVDPLPALWMDIAIGSNSLADGVVVIRKSALAEIGYRPAPLLAGNVGCG